MVSDIQDTSMSEAQELEFERKPRSRNLFKPDSSEPFKLSRSKLEDFVRCPRCFYLDRRLGVGQPQTPGYSLNNAVDELLKREFDEYRAKGEPHPLMIEHGVNAVPFFHKDLDKWRANFTGVQHFHEPTNFLVTGAVDDIWINPDGELIVVDYKATSVNDAVTAETHLRASYRRQLDIYHWLLKSEGFSVCGTGYLVYANARKDKPGFSGRLDFDLTIIPHTIESSWVETRLQEAHACLSSDTPPEPSSWCEHCAYRYHARIAFGL